MLASQLADMLTMAIGSLALLATLVLTFFGFRLISEFNQSINRIQAIEKELTAERDQLKSLRMVSSILFRYVDAAYTASKIEQNTISDILEYIPRDGDQENFARRRKAFAKGIEASQNDAVTISAMLEVLAADDPLVDDKLEILLNHIPQGPLKGEARNTARRAYELLEAMRVLTLHDGGLATKYRAAAEELLKKTQLPASMLRR